jgi:hypothetical protein
MARGTTQASPAPIDQFTYGAYTLKVTPTAKAESTHSDVEIWGEDGPVRPCAVEGIESFQIYWPDTYAPSLANEILAELRTKLAEVFPVAA